jgi:uncharacterized SAM-binding protein YcdF (DUF218 family)
MRLDVVGMLVLLTEPLHLSLVLAGIGVLAALLHRRRLGGALLLASIAWTAVWSIPQCADWLRAPLEQRYQAPAIAALPEVDAIVVLGGGSLAPTSEGSGRLGLAAQAWFARRAPYILVSGGGGRMGNGRGRSEAAKMARALNAMGVPASALVLEDRSRNTRENAAMTAALARERGGHRVVLVTSALHMPRASLEFRHAGLDVIPLPAFDAPDDRADRWRPSRRALWRSGRGLKEYAGLLALGAGIASR